MARSLCRKHASISRLVSEHMAEVAHGGIRGQGSAGAALSARCGKDNCGLRIIQGRGGYLSFGNYAFRAKCEHLMRGGDDARWTEHLRSIFNQCRDSVGRGIGASRQSKPLDLVKVVQTTGTSDPVVPGGPIGTVDFAIAGCFFLLREIEISAARIEHLAFASDQSSVSWQLPSSKTDPRAVGVSRTWDCTCGVQKLAGACPVHALARQKRRVQ